ncbi:MAG: malonate transporter subunit MadL [Caulobacteraceae bacterium]
MTIFGVALLAVCTLMGALLGDLLGMALHVKSNVGGVGIAMILLILARAWLQKRGALSHPMKLGVEFWASLYIPIVVAMASIQNVAGAIKGGPVVVTAAVGSVLLCWLAMTVISRLGGRDDEGLASPAAAHVLAGDPE